ncbi:uncharacterized protein EI97DRAFT_220944 [Westerdykella ornata]|uniref:Pheromone alpha factor receptor n=1 Tax=Westerdykella ornata TaxID=318751 RepID=A0A6A6JSX0_WESOR|nr:uncharacterized protein EI97DRAFT_220944 [Westerdykella ornata]KAF2278836.1 hypothetical protein EI97DRAFT_220944 [Westerdykella ornata]
MATPTSSPVPLPPDFNPFEQPFTLIGGDGVPFNVTMKDVDHLREFGVRLAINYGTQIGASIVLLVMLLLLTRREKRRSAIFVLNALCLAVNIVRSVLQSRYLTGHYFNVYSILAADTSHDTDADLANTVASNTMTLLLVICIMASLSMQVWVVCKTAPTWQRIVIMCVTTAIALVAVGYRFAVTVISNDLALKETPYGMVEYQWLLDQMNIMQAVAIWVYCAVFTAKLGHALISRRRMGMTQFGPMQIVFIMGAQTMVIPAIFAVLQFNKDVPELGSQTLTVVCLFLPLSAIWAGVVASDNELGASSGGGVHRLLVQDQFGRSSGAGSPNSSRFMHGGSKGTASTLVSSFGAKEMESPVSAGKRREGRGEGEDGIYVDREWGVKAEREGEGEGEGPSREKDAYGHV